jgi:hypothetical protein
MSKLFDKFSDRSQEFVTKFDNELKRYDCLMEGRTWSNTACSGAYAEPTADKKAQAKIVRDAVLYQLTYVTDQNYSDFENDLYAKRATGSFLADFVETGANLAGNISNGIRAKNIIFASIAAFRTNRKSYNLNYFQEQTTNLLVLKMQTSRNRVLKEIVVQRARSVEDYPMEAALGDAIRYFFAGTLPKAFQELQQDTSVQAKQAEQELLRFKGIPIEKPMTVEQSASAVNANDVLIELATMVGTGSTADKSLALGKLQKILEDIKADAALLSSIRDSSTLATHLSAMESHKADGPTLANDINELKRAMDNTPMRDIAAKVNAIIIKNAKTSK